VAEGDSQKAPAEPSPGARPRPIIGKLIWARRLCQALFLGLFLVLLVLTASRGEVASAEEPVRVGLPVEAFFMVNPLVALLTLLSGHAVYRGLLWSLVTVALTVVFGRAFCGWICPLGTLHQIVGWVRPSRLGSGARRIAQNRTHPLRQQVKYYLLFASLGAAALGSAVGGLLDPIGLAVRGIGLAVLPAAQYAVRSVAEAAAASGIGPLERATQLLSDVLALTLWSPEPLRTYGAWLLGLVLVAALVMNRFIPRFWCRVLCPLGALLGLLSRFSLFGLRKDEAKCTHCNRCLQHCQGADSPEGGARWRQHDCHLCLNCEAACPEGVIRFGFLPHRGGTDTRPDTSRRTALGALAAGAALVPAARSGGVLDAHAHARLIRPPGSRAEREFLERCIRCGECMKVCPNGALHPALHEAGLEGLWTPMLIARLGYCEQSCVLCSEVCPTGAIEKIGEAHRLGTDGQQAIAIGTAFFDRGRCLPWAMATDCIVCEEFCPTSPKAIWVEEAEVPTRAFDPNDPEAPPEPTTVKVRRPYVDPARCIGCGACENACPVRGRAAVYVTSVGESRSETNVILLRRKG